ncbi:MAG: DUF2807 domain-containing protein, partial [Chloroflexota bacterium]
MKHRVFLLLTLVLLLAACNIRRGDNGDDGGGSGNVITEEREVSGFDKVRVDGSGNVEIVQGDGESLVIEAEDNIMSSIESRVEDGVLILSEKPNINTLLTKPIRYTVSMIDVAGLEIDGSGDINADSLDVSILSLSISGSGNINIAELDADSINASINGSGNITISG